MVQQDKSCLINTTIVLSVISLALVIVACVGYTDNAEQLQDTAWATSQYPAYLYTDPQGNQHILTADIYLGLTTIAFKVVFNGQNYFQTKSIQDGTCKDTGKSTLTLNVISCFFIFWVIFFSIFRSYSNIVFLKGLTIAISIIIVVLLICAFSSWNTQCFNNIDSVTPNANQLSNDVTHYIGFSTTVTAMCLTVVVMLIHFYVDSDDVELIESIQTTGKPPSSGAANPSVANPSAANPPPVADNAKV